MPGGSKCLICLLYTVISQPQLSLLLSITSHSVAVLLISFQTALSSGYSVLSLSHLLSCLGTVIFVAVSEMCIRGLIHQENNQTTSYINKTKQSLLGSSFPSKIDLFPKQAHSMIAQTAAVAQLEAATSGCAMRGRGRTVCVSVAAKGVLV